MILNFNCCNLRFTVSKKIARHDGEKYAIAYFPTHIRYSSWIIGIIAGYIFKKFPEKDSVRIPKVFGR